MAKRKQFGSLPKKSRDRAARIGKEKFGLSREEVRKQYNRGTYNPFARANPELRVPREFQEAVIVEDGRVSIDWGQLAFENYHRHLGPGSVKGETYKYNRFTVAENTTERASERVQRIMALASEDELRMWASPQADANGDSPPFETFISLPPAGLTLQDVGYYDSGGSWNNIFWYH